MLGAIRLCVCRWSATRTIGDKFIPCSVSLSKTLTTPPCHRCPPLNPCHVHTGLNELLVRIDGISSIRSNRSTCVKLFTIHRDNFGCARLDQVAP